MINQERGARSEERELLSFSNLEPRSSNLEPRSSNLEPRSSILAPRTSVLDPRSCSAGFTLIEMVVVVVILAMVAMLVFPRLPSSEATNLRGSARNLAAAIRYLGDKSITTKTAYRLKIDLTDNTLAVSKVVNGEEVSDTDPFFSRRLLTEGIMIEDVLIPRLGKLSVGEVTVSFGPAGLEDFVTIHLKGTREGHFTVVAYPQNGKVKVLEGYQEVEQ